MIGVSDAYGVLYDSEGLDIYHLLERRDSFGTVTNLFSNVITNQDLLASSSGVIVSYFEWVQNNQGYYWSEEEVSEKLRKAMVDTFENISQTSQVLKVDMR